MDGRKTYRFTVRWGEERDTDDAEGRVVDDQRRAGPTPRPSRRCCRASPAPSSRCRRAIRRSRSTASGPMTWRATARPSNLRPAPVDIHRLELVDTPDPDHAVFAAECGKGTYVRALARDIGRAARLLRPCLARCGGAGSARFSESDMISLEQLEALCHRAAAGEGSLADTLLPVETALDDIPALAVSPADAARLHRGQAVLLRGRDAPNLPRHGPGRFERPARGHCRDRPRRNRPQARVQLDRRRQVAPADKRVMTMSITTARKAEVIKTYADKGRRHRFARSAGRAPVGADQST